ncbi:MAG: hypothetical protein LBQ76_02550 [Candidatus Fibromonas sp.]|jgi:hypothetical protein|nr:hypothetical protein [Candidatus Fibromonas sp.]
MPDISDIILMDVSKILPHSYEKFCVCISSSSKYFYINSLHREMYDDFEIKSSDYGFLKHDSHVGCHKAHLLGDELVIRKIGKLNRKDMMKILNKIKNSKHLPKAEKESISCELEEWLNNCQENKLNDFTILQPTGL